MPEEPLLLACGVTTSVGLSVSEVAASVRAGTSRFLMSDYHDKEFEPFTVSEVPEEGLPELQAGLKASPLTARESRLVRLSARSLTDALVSAQQAGRRLPVFLSLPESETLTPLDRQRFGSYLAQQVPGIDPGAGRSDFVGRAGGLSAVGAACQAVAAGKIELAVAGGVDTFLDLSVLAQLDSEERIKSDVNFDGFIPGEAAGFVLVGTRRAATTLRAQPMARLTETVEATEPGHLYSAEPYRGSGLAQAFGSLLKAAPPPKPVINVFSSMNGESFWGKEWAVALTRNRSHFAPAMKIFHPADCYGDAGAAAGPVMIALAAHGIAHAYRQGPTLIYCSNDRAPRAAMMVLPL